MKNKSSYQLALKGLSLTLLLSAIGLFVFHFKRDTSINFLSHELRNIEQLRTTILLSKFFGVEKNYDRLSQSTHELDLTLKSLKKSLNSIEDKKLKKKLLLLLKQYEIQSIKRKKLIDQFISLNAVFKNSQSYYAILSHNIIRNDENLSDESRLLFLNKITAFTKLIIQNDYQNLSSKITFEHNSKRIELLKKHLHIISNNGLKINKILHDFPNINVDRELFLLKQSYLTAADKSENILHYLKVSLTLSAICLALLAAALLKNNLEYSKELSIMNSSLEKKVKQRTKKLEDMAQSLILAKDEAEASSRSKGRFLANMSHEIRTPMNGIIGFTNILADTPLDEEQKHHVETVQQSAESLLTIINDILDFSKIEEGKMELEEIPVNIHAIIEHTVIFFQALLLDKHQVTLHAEGLDHIKNKLYLSDPSRIRQIIINLVSNAVKFTKKGTVKILISEIDEKNEHESFSIHVNDTGLGISEEGLKKIFKPFDQEDASMSRKYGGTGLGLSISSQLAELLGGGLSVKSTLGEGSTFSFKLKLKRDVSLFSESVDINKNLNWKADPKILLVEDNKVNQKLTMMLLKKEKLSAEIAENGLEAYQKFIDHKYDLILMDCQMPEMDGFESTNKIRAYEREHSLGHIPIIALTANAMAGDRERCIKSGMDDFLSKPIDKERLKFSLSQWLSPFLL